MAYLNIPAFQQSVPVVDGQGRFTPAALRALNGAIQNLVGAVNAIAQIPEIQVALQNLDNATQAALDAAATAQQAADQAQGSTDAQRRETALQASSTDPPQVVSANATTIMVAAHTRRYADDTSVSVNAGTVPATASGDTDYVFYDDPSRAGGNVTYQVSLTQPIQSGDRHVVGAVTIPDATVTQPVDGGESPSPPGRVYPRKLQGNIE